MTKTCIGVSIFATKDENFWRSDINQAIVFLVMLLRQLPTVGKVYLLNGGDAEQLPRAEEFIAQDVPLVQPASVSFELDVVIEMGARLPPAWMRHMRALGVKLVGFHMGHLYTQVMEAAIFDRCEISLLNDTPLHEVWCLPSNEPSHHAVLRTVTRAPVLTMPQLWSPIFLQREVDELEDPSHAFGFEARQRARSESAGWRVAIFSPNTSVLESHLTPMLVCEQAYRQEPASLSLMMVMNTFDMKMHLTFNRFATHLDLTRHDKATYEPRMAFVRGMAGQALDAIVSHQTCNAPSHLHAEALYGGYPLIHNSPLLHVHSQGFYYPGFEACEGARQLLQAWQSDPGRWHDYAHHARTYLAHLLPTQTHNARAFMSRLHRADAPALEVTA